ncbi:MAG: precorrin-6A reductase [Lachnospiraceae bacterium]|nr:precorrin-6A reductase [Lachnospiraceae bacterium]
MANRIVVFSGTTEGREITEKLAELKCSGDALNDTEIEVYVATEYGSKEMGEIKGAKVIPGRKELDDIRTIAAGALAVVDATHPYAAVVTKYLKEACDESGAAYFRIKRAESGEYEGVRVSSIREAADYLANTEGKILLSTGSKELKEYAGVDPERLVARVLPLKSSLESCEEAGIPARNVIAAQGPFSEEFNEAIMHQYDIRYMVTKDGGSAGGFPEKMAAAAACGVTAVVIERPEDTGSSASEVFEKIRRLL